MLLSLWSPFPYFPSQNPKPSKPFLIRCSSSSSPNSAIQRISEKLRNLGYLQNPNPNPNPQTLTLTSTAAGEIFIPTPQELPVHRVGHTIDSSWSTPESPVPVPGMGISRFRELWKKEKEEMKKGKLDAENSRVPMAAEMMIGREELKRLRRVGIRIEKRLKVGKAGITEGIVNGIHERWRRSELVKIKCEDLCRMNMKRTHEILERKTGGLVVWRSGCIIILYRGANYKYPYFIDGSQVNCNLDNTSEDHNTIYLASAEQEQSTLSRSAVNQSIKSPNNLSHSSLVIGVGSPNKVRLQLPGEVQFEEEANQLLDGLGPRFNDWWGYEPLPVDADMLPPIVPGFRKPFRLLPFGVKPKLTDREMTILRRLSRPIPCHFALGRNKNLQGLAVSMIKLWEKCEIAKIAIKRGIQNTNSEMMVEELKQLTGGVLLSRDKEFITFYRGKDFLPSAVSIAIEERRNSEVGRDKQSIYDSFIDNTTAPPLSISRPPPVDDLPEAVKQTRSIGVKNRLKPASLAIKRAETRLSQALEKKEKAEKLLATLEKSIEPPQVESDKEAITEEERYMLRKIGLGMKPFLLLGRRGVFAGTVENMHLHWKYRELIKIISKDRSIVHVENAARILEAESGGILVAVERVSKGHAIIMYRGKNYQRPADLKPKTLLNKKQAMKRSLEAQRCASLKLHVLSLSRNIDHLQHQMAKEYSAANTIQPTKSDESNIEDDLNERNLSIVQDKGSVNSSCHMENAEEVNEAAAEYLSSNNHGRLLNHEEKSTTTSDSDRGSTFSFNLRQDNWNALKPVDESSDSEDVGLDTDSIDSTKLTDNIEEHIYNEPDFHSKSCPRQDQVSISTASDSSHHSVKDEVQSLFGATQINPDHDVSEDLMNDCSDIKNSFRAAPLSNRERLILRKQALKMEKRPVLAVGRNNVVTGVAKTIMTHFKKHPLAIVNIKGIAKGTSVQEVIFELEQATGAVLVSREPNKVILYRGWGEGEAPGSNTKLKKDAKKGVNSVNAELETIYPRLVEAIRIECELSTSRDE